MKRLGSTVIDMYQLRKTVLIFGGSVWQCSGKGDKKDTKSPDRDLGSTLGCDSFLTETLSITGKKYGRDRLRKGNLHPGCILTQVYTSLSWAKFNQHLRPYHVYDLRSLTFPQALTICVPSYFANTRADDLCFRGEL